MSTVLLEAPIRHWACPSCKTVTSTTDPAPLHVCIGLGGRRALLVEVPKLDAKPDARHVLQEREDFMGGWYGADRYMSLRTDHGDGSNDITVYAPCALTQLVEPEGPQASWSTSATLPFNLGQILTKNISLSGDTFKANYFNNSVTPSNSATTAATSCLNNTGCAFQAANEQTTSGNYTVSSGTTVNGMAVNTPAVTQNYNSQGNNTVSFTATSITSATSFTTISGGVFGMTITDTTYTQSSYGTIICYNYFGGAQQVTSGTFAVTINANGLATYTC